MNAIMLDIACGLQEAGLKEFAASVSAAHMGQWLELGLFDDGLDGWGQAFCQAVTRTLEKRGRIHFNLAGLDVTEALKGDPEHFTGRYTAYELQQIVRNPLWFNSTLFYLDGAILTAEQLKNLGIQKAGEG